MTVQTADLVISRVNFVRKKYRVFGLIVPRATESDSALHYIIPTHNKQNQHNKSDINFISVERNRLHRRDSFLIIREFFQTAIDLQQHKHDNGENQRKYS